MTGEWIWQPTQEWIERTNVYRFMRRLGFDTLDAFLEFSRSHSEEFWDEMVREVGIEWFEPYDKVLDDARGVEWARWFVNGKLNVAWNCLDRHARGPGAEHCAVLWEGEDGASRAVTYAELARQVNRLANGLAALGLRPGDRVALAMPMVPEVVAILYACFKLGLIAVPVFSGFGAGAIADRLEDSGARIVFTADWLERRGKLLPLKEKIDQALAMLSGDSRPAPSAAPATAQPAPPPTSQPAPPATPQPAPPTTQQPAPSATRQPAPPATPQPAPPPTSQPVPPATRQPAPPATPQPAPPAASPGRVEKVIVWRYKGGEVAWTPGRDLQWEDVERGPDECESLHLDSEHPALILYTSGTTGRPKGAVHTHAGCLAQTSKEIYLAFDHRDPDRFFWLSDIGWMMGPWEIVGNHHFGGTVFLYDGAPDFPGPDRLWRMIERHRIDVFGVSPTAVRMAMKHGSDMPRSSDLSSLRLLGSTGEPWDEASYRWFFENVGGGRLPIVNISGGTEIIGCFLQPMPMQALKPCSLGGPAPGMSTEVVDDEGRPVRGRTGYLVCTRPAPSMTRGVWGDPQRYLDTYWSRWKGIWNHGDWASVDEDGCWFLYGRADESMNVAGRKVGPGEIERALMAHPLVLEAAAIGVPDQIKGEAIAAFVVVRPGTAITAGVLEEIAGCVAANLGTAFRPRTIQVVAALPKTQSGKVVRRLIRQSYLGEPLGDVSTLADASALKAFSTSRAR